MPEEKKLVPTFVEDIPPRPAPLTPRSDEERKDYMQNAGRTTIQRQQLKVLQAIQQYLFLILLVMSLAVAVWLGIKISNGMVTDSIFAGVLTVVLGIITYIVSNSSLSDNKILRDSVEQIYNSITRKNR